MKLIDEIVGAQDEIRDIRRDIHAHPELKFEELRTSELVAKKLESWGIEVHRGLGITGLVGVIHGNPDARDIPVGSTVSASGASVSTGGSTVSKGSKAIGLRADMDALPMTEFNQFPHASIFRGKMHACGHDGHTAMLLGAAKHLAKHRSFNGTVYLIFQPGEEGGGGALEMMKDGLFSRFPMDAVFGMHNWPDYPAGTFGIREGPVMASSNVFKVRITGRGSHAALPHHGIDPVPIACQMVQAFQTIVTRNLNPTDNAVISVTMIQAGEATNVIPDYAEIQGTVRTFTVEVLDKIEARMREIAQHTAAAFGTECSFEFSRNYPPTINSEAEALFARNVMASIVGADRVHAQEPTMGAEDFSYMLMAKPGCYAFIANGDGAHREFGHGTGPCMLHNPSYDFNDELLPLGATYWVRLAQSWLAPKA
ncbi:MAG: amidohydrolase [Betaproteobacteria bacterium]|nr:amidohydrolase [Betaproteobacteria bacterium]